MSSQIQITGETKVKSLTGVLVGTSGVVSSVPLGAANGVATLDSGGKVPVSQLPSSVVTYLGTWNAATNTPTLVNGTGDAGDMYLCNVAGTVNFGAGPVTFVVGDWVLYGSGTWQKSNGQNGTVTSVGLSTNAGAITIGSSPITTSGTITANFNGTNLQYVNGAGNLTTFPILTGFVPYTGATQDVNLGAFLLTASGVDSVGYTARGSGTLSGYLILKQGTTFLGNVVGYNSINANARKYVFISDVDGTNYKSAIFELSSLTNNTDRTYTLPDASGTIALTSNISYPVTSVFGRTGAVVATSGDYTTAQVTESGNLYFTDSRARLALSFVAGSGAYNSTTGVITIPTNNNQITNGSNYITLGSLSAGVGISYNNTTGVITNSAPDQTVALTASTGISVTGTYPNFTITNTSPSSGGTVTSVAALTIGTSGTDLSSSVANSTTTPVITLNVPTASATNRGALSSADWTTFNSKQSALTNPVTGTGTTNYLPKFTGASAIGNSLVYDDGTNVGVGTITPSSKLTSLKTITSNFGAKGNAALALVGAGSVGEANLINFGYDGESWQPAYIGYITTNGSGSSNGALIFGTRGVTTNSQPTERMRLDASGNLGLGVTPSAWGSGTKAFQLQGGSLWSYSSAYLDLYQNGYYDGTYNIYLTTAAASFYRQSSGSHQWYNAPSGTAGNAITFTQAMTLTSAGNLGLGTPTPTDFTIYGYGPNIDAHGGRGGGFVSSNSDNSVKMTMGVDGSSSVGQLKTLTNHAIMFATNDAEKMRLFSGGNLSIGYGAGPTDAGYKLDVNGTGRFSGAVAITTALGLLVQASSEATIRLNNTGGGTEWRLNSYTNGNLYFQSAAGATNAVYFTSAGAGVFSSSLITASELTTGGNIYASNANIKLYTYQNVAGQYRYIGTEYAPGNGNNKAEIRFGIDGSDTRTKISFHVANGGGTINEALSIGYTGAATFSSSVTAAGLYNNGLTSLINTASNAGAIDAGKSEFITTGFNLANSGSEDISTITLPSNTQWKAIITGGFANNYDGGGLVSPNFSRDIDGTNSTIVAGSTTITFSRNASTGKLQATNNFASARVTFVGTIHLVTFPQSYIPTNTRAFFGNVGIGTTSPEVMLQLGDNTSTNKVFSVRYSSVPLYINGGFDGTNALSTFSTNNYNTSSGSYTWGSFSNTGYSSAAVQLASNTGGSEIRFLTAAASNTNPTTRLTIASTGAATFSSSVTAGSSGNEFVYKAASSSIGVVGNWVGYLYGFNTSSYNKGATIFESTDGNGRGKFHIALNNDANSTNVSIADAKLTILPSGNVLIGTSDDGGRVVSYTTNAAQQFKAAGTAPAITFSNTVLSPTYGGVLGTCTSANQFLTGTSAGDMVLANQFSGYRVYVASYSGGVYLTSGATSWTANSDIRLKNINSHIENAVEKLSTLQTINFSYKDDKTNKQNLGLIAQEVEKIFPELIDKNGDGMLGVRYTELVPVLIKAIQEQQKEINELKLKIK